MSHKLLKQTISRRQFLKAAAATGVISAVSWRAPFRGYAQSDVPADLLAAVEQEGGKLNVFNWSFYIAENTIPDFQDEFGIEVTYDLYEGNDEMLARVQAAPGQFDISVPTQDVVIEMRELGLLQPLNHAWLPNMVNLDDQFVDPGYDPGNQYSIAYQWGTTGIAYNEKFAGDDPRLDSWRLLFEGEQYSGKMTMIDDSSTTIGEALKLLGFSMNSSDEDELLQAREILLKQKPLLQAYISGPVRELLASEDVWIANLWSGDTFFVRDELNESVQYSIPKEGGEIWTDSMVILKGAPHPATAHLWINYILRPQVGADISNFVFYATPNKASLPLLDPELREDPVVFPSDELRARLEFLLPPTGRARELRDQIWEELKS